MRGAGNIPLGFILVPFQVQSTGNWMSVYTLLMGRAPLKVNNKSQIVLLSFSIVQKKSFSVPKFRYTTFKSHDLLIKATVLFSYWEAILAGNKASVKAQSIMSRLIFCLDRLSSRDIIPEATFGVKRRVTSLNGRFRTFLNDFPSHFL